MNSKDIKRQLAQIQTLESELRRPFKKVLAVFICAVFAVLLTSVIAAFCLATFGKQIALPLGLLLIGLGLVMVIGSLTILGPKGIAARRQARRLIVEDLSQFSHDELHLMVDIHLRCGRIDEADRLSKHLLQVSQQDTY